MNYKKIFKRETKVIAYVVICLTLVVIGTSYALFLQVNDNTNNQVVKAGSLTITYSGGNQIQIDNNDENNCLAPQSDTSGSGSGGCSFELSIKNEGTLPMQYDLLIYNNEQSSNLVDHSLIKHSLKKKIDTAEVETVTDVKSLGELEKYQESQDKEVLENSTIEPGKTIVFYLKIWIDENASEDIIGKTVNLKLDVIGSVKEKTLADKVDIGDYISMTPTLTSYTILASETGHESDQTINPSELNLWRVINKNVDGTVDVVSEYVSSEKVSFYGQTGYLNLVGALNKIAASYENSAYTVGSRHMGYNDQTEYLNADNVQFSSPAPWTTSTGTHGNQYESQGGGDILYEKDVNLVKTAYENELKAFKVGTTSYATYWISSRLFDSTNYPRPNMLNWTARLVGAGVSPYGSGVSSVQYYLYSIFDDAGDDGQGSNSIRPILTLRYDLNFTGGGKSASDPLILQ